MARPTEKHVKRNSAEQYSVKKLEEETETVKQIYIQRSQYDHWYVL